MNIFLYKILKIECQPIVFSHTDIEINAKWNKFKIILGHYIKISLDYMPPHLHDRPDHMNYQTRSNSVTKACNATEDHTAYTSVNEMVITIMNKKSLVLIEKPV